MTSTVVAPGGITLPDVLTESDLFTNLDTSLLFPQTLDLEPVEKRPGGMDFGSQLLPDSSFRRSVSQEPARLEDPSLVDLDFGDDELPLGNDPTMEMGRDAPAPRPVEEDLFSDAGKFNEGDDLELDLGDDDAPLDRMDLDDGHDMNDLLPDAPMDFGNDEFDGGETPRAADNRFERDTESPLSTAGSDQMNLLEEEFNRDESATPDATSVQQGQRTKRQRLMALDKEVAISSSKFKDQQNDRSSIMKPASFLPRDPVLLTLMTRQQNGDFVSSVFGEDRGRGWAPELRGMLSLNSAKKAGELKRKRDSGISDIDLPTAELPALELGDEEATAPIDEGIALDATMNQHSEIEFPADDEEQLHLSDDGGMEQGIEELDDTITHPVDTEPVSMGTKHAVHILREKLGDSASQQKKSVLFQDMLPEQRSSKADATKMFFEVLVLATKDAVKVEQGAKSIGGPLKIHGKQALWGSWAEENAAGAMNQLSQAL